MTAQQKLFISVVLALLSFVNVRATDLDAVLQGHWPKFHATVRTVTASGTFAYVGFDYQGIVIFDLTDPAKVSPVGQFPLNGTVRSSCISGNYLFAGTDSGVTIIDVSDRQNPQRVGGYALPGLHALAVSGSFLYLTGTDVGLVILDVSDPQHPGRVGNFNTLPDLRFGEHIAVQNDYAYLSFGSAGFLIFNVADPASPKLSTLIDTPGSAHSIALSERYAYVADGSALLTYNIQFPGQPRLTSSLPDADFGTYAVAVFTNKLCVAKRGTGLQLFDLTNPAVPKLSATFQSQHAYDLSILGGQYACLVDNYKGLEVINITNASSLRLAGAYDTASSLTSVHVTNNYAYLTDRESGLQIIDVSDKSNPIKVNTNIVATPAYFEDLAVSGSYAYVATGRGLQIFDITNPVNPKKIGSAGSNFQKVALSGNFAYLNLNGSISIYDLQNPSQPVFSGTLTSSNIVSKMVASGRYLYLLAQSRTNFQIFDIADATHPNLVSTYKTASNARDIAIDDRYAYLVEYDTGLEIVDISDASTPRRVGGLSGVYPGVMTLSGNHLFLNEGVIDISDPAQPFPVGGYTQSNPIGDPVTVAVLGDYIFTARETSGLEVVHLNPAYRQRISTQSITNARAIAISGSHAYVAADTGGLEIFQLDPVPKKVGVYDTPGNAKAVLISGNYAYVADGNPGLQVLDVSTPSDPFLVGTFDTGNASGLAIKDNYVFVADGSSGLQIIDVSIPAAPTKVGSVDTPGAAVSVFVLGNYAYVADFYNGVQVIDITTPTDPQLVGTCYTGGITYDLTVSDGYAYVADGLFGGFKILDITNPTDPRIVGSYQTYAALDLTLFQNTAWIADANGGLQVFDISNPLRAVRVGGNSTFDARSIAIADGKIVCIGAYNLTALDLGIPPPAELRLQPRLSSGEFRLLLQGPPGSEATLERSSQLSDWTFWRKASLGTLPTEITDPESAEDTNRFYRLRIPTP